jgi:hypothetical protein
MLIGQAVKALLLVECPPILYRRKGKASIVQASVRNGDFMFLSNFRFADLHVSHLSN